MILTKKRILFVTIIVIFWALILLCGIQRCREDTLKQKQVSTRSLQAQEQVTREYIPVKLNEKGSEELTRMGANLWGE